MKWRRRTEITGEEVMAMAQSLDIDPLLSRILLNRGMNEDESRIIIKERHRAIMDPSLLVNGQEAAERIASYCRNVCATIWIFADYDADGITSGYVMKKALEEVALCKVKVYYPERKEKYGLNMDFAKKLVAETRDKEDLLVVTVDNGVAQVEQINYLIDNGIEVVVTDHHMSKEEVPRCLIVDPHNAHGEQNGVYNHLCGCGVAFKVAQMVQERFDVYDMMKYTPYLAIGTLADMMPMHPENISLIQYGLDIMNSSECPEGIKAFKEFTGKKTLTATDISWELGPRINACGRMGDTSLASELFFESNDYDEVLLKIEKKNMQRKNFSDEAKKLIDSLDFSEENVCVIDATEFPEGIIGIIAGKIVEKFKKPAIVVASHGDEGVLSGSARTVSGIGLQELLKNEVANGNLQNFGGHDAAAGLTIYEDKFEAFKESINKQVAAIIASMPEGEVMEEELIIDELIELSHINEATYQLINEIPYDGKTFPAPTFALAEVTVESFKTSAKNPLNICFKLREGGKLMDIWAWGMADKYAALGSPKKMHIAGHIERNFMSPKNFTLKVVDFMGA